MNWLVFVLRWFHLMAAITAVGGTIFMRFALVPTAGLLPDDHRKLLQDAVRARWAKFVHLSIAFLLITGFVNWFIFLQDTKAPGWEQWRQSYSGLYQAIWGIKVLLALAIFFIASALAGRGEATKKFRDNAKYWMTVNVTLALVVVALSGVLRLTHTGPTPTIAPTSAGSGSGNG